MRQIAKNKAVNETEFKQMEHTKPSIFYIIAVCLAPFVILGLGIAFIHFKPAKSQIKVLPEDEIAHKITQRLVNSLRNLNDNTEFAFSIRDMGRILNTTSQKESIIRETKNQDFSFYAWQAIKSLTDTCNNFNSYNKVKLILYIIHDLAKIGCNITSDIEASQNVLYNCKSQEELIYVTFDTLTVIAKHQNLPEGTVKLCVDYALSMGHGPWSKNIAATLTECELNAQEDIKAFNKYVDQEIHDKELWSREFYEAFCKLMHSKNISDNDNICQEFEL